METTASSASSKPIFMKWSSSNISGSDPATYKSYLKDMHKIKGKGIVNTVLQEGQEFINSGLSSIEITKNKKEMHIDKISERELIPQTNMNPFLHGAQSDMGGNKDYINDITVQEKYLIPKNSNMFC
tara:strand:- start:425 stop:805 length:381 start_codon:yes stop_codon:yes gene_type:complete